MWCRSGASRDRRKPKAPASIDAVSVLDPDTGGLAKPYKRTVAAALPHGVNPPEKFWHDLETAVRPTSAMRSGNELPGQSTSSSAGRTLAPWRRSSAKSCARSAGRAPRSTFEPFCRCRRYGRSSARPKLACLATR